MQVEAAKCVVFRESREAVPARVLEHRVREEMQGQPDDAQHHMLLLHQHCLVQSKQQLWPLDLF